MIQYTSVKVPQKLSDRIKNSDYFKDYGFTSVSSFVLFATRELLRNGTKEG